MEPGSGVGRDAGAPERIQLEFKRGGSNSYKEMGIEEMRARYMCVIQERMRGEWAFPDHARRISTHIITRKEYIVNGPNNAAANALLMQRCAQGNAPRNARE